MNEFDVIIIGSGMGGSACAVVLSKIGLKVAIIERGVHPRFAIGESATPVMSKKIRHLGEIYDVPEFIHLSTYDRIKGAGVDIKCGPKELFHYFIHDKGQENIARDGEFREFIVQTPEVDAQYLRADSDALMVDIAIKYGATYLDKTSVENIDFHNAGVDLRCTTESGDLNLYGQFIIDATGFRSIIGDKLDLKIQGDDLAVPLKSRSIFAHFSGVESFEGMLEQEEGFVDRSPAPRARATQHHCFEGGWLWVIPFEDGKVSIGLNLDMDYFPMNDKPAEEEFREIIAGYPIIERLLASGENIMPFVKTGRMQFINKEMVGDRWAMLPASAYGLDAWFSTGLASSFIAVHRLAEILGNRIFPGKRFSRSHLMDYELAMKKEYRHVSKMIHGMYKSFRHFDVFKQYCAMCFMGAESYIASGGVETAMDESKLLLNAGNSEFVSKFAEVYEDVIRLSGQEKVSSEETDRIRDVIRHDMTSFNFRRFGDPEMMGMHPRVAMS